MRVFKYILLVIFLFFSSASILGQKTSSPSSPSVDNKRCEVCHKDPDLSYTRYGVNISLQVTSDSLMGSPHEGFRCVDCHTDLKDVKGLTHDKNLILPDCGTCHQEAQREFIHGFFQPLKDKGYSYIPNCQDCHGKHKVTFKGEPKKVCGICHQDVLQDFKKSIHWNIPEDKRLTCTSCHSPHFKHERSKYTEKMWRLYIVQSCNKCHKDKVKNYIDSQHFIKLKEGDLKAPLCTDCHSKHKILLPRHSESNVSIAKLDGLCIKCHAGYINSIHTPQVHHDQRLKSCIACHSGHETDMTTAKSVIFDKNIGEICLTCHEQTLLEEVGPEHKEIHSNQIGLIKSGKTQNCGVCHKYHYKPTIHPEYASLKKECGECHAKELREYEESTHFISRAKGHTEAPDCISCHHNLEFKQGGQDFKGQAVVNLCTRCHNNREVTLKFQLNPDVVKTYNTSHHGQMFQLGYQGEKYATCSSCHHHHTILFPENPESSVSKQNLIKTCSKCHQEADERFIGYLQHYTPRLKKQNSVFSMVDILFKILFLAALIICGIFALMKLLRKVSPKIKKGSTNQDLDSSKKTLPIKAGDWILHILGVTLVFILTATGLLLKYSYSVLANWISHQIISLEALGTLHRISGFILFGLFIIHLVVVFYRTVFKAQPQIEGNGYFWDTFNYLIVLLGILLIAISGMVIQFSQYFSKISSSLLFWAHLIHTEQALLIIGIIFIVNFFYASLKTGTTFSRELISTGKAEEKKWKVVLFKTLDFFFITISIFLLIMIIIGNFF